MTAIQSPSTATTANSSVSRAKIWRAIQTIVADDDSSGLARLTRHGNATTHVTNALLEERLANDPSRLLPSHKHRVLQFDKTIRLEAFRKFGKSTKNLNALQVAMFQLREGVACQMLGLIRDHAPQDLAKFVGHTWGDRNSSLHLACFLGMPELVQLLLACGADPTAENMRRVRPTDCCHPDDACRIALDKYLVPVIPAGMRAEAAHDSKVKPQPVKRKSTTTSLSSSTARSTKRPSWGNATVKVPPAGASLTPPCLQVAAPPPPPPVAMPKLNCVASQLPAPAVSDPAPSQDGAPLKNIASASPAGYQEDDEQQYLSARVLLLLATPDCYLTQDQQVEVLPGSAPLDASSPCKQVPPMTHDLPPSPALSADKVDLVSSDTDHGGSLNDKLKISAAEDDYGDLDAFFKLADMVCSSPALSSAKVSPSAVGVNEGDGSTPPGQASVVALKTEPGDGCLSSCAASSGYPLIPGQDPAVSFRHWTSGDTDLCSSSNNETAGRAPCPSGGGCRQQQQKQQGDPPTQLEAPSDTSHVDDIQSLMDIWKTRQGSNHLAKAAPPDDRDLALLTSLVNQLTRTLSSWWDPQQHEHDYRSDHDWNFNNHHLHSDGGTNWQDKRGAGKDWNHHYHAGGGGPGWHCSDWVHTYHERLLDGGHCKDVSHHHSTMMLGREQIVAL
ncbi:hypothetical protein BCR43DRAFT_524766 [Syncephalastrum racemosum]|uniref:Uncharacterized protein n=1 Tax=Syncephalastrum racemosum TaxID=13706 RepID=A0A1X2HD28_SYNRA|nr:hypothetical protein BCR43DRAFT_524766 [Syncephalastrum racemosum]